MSTIRDVNSLKENDEDDDEHSHDLSEEEDREAAAKVVKPTTKNLTTQDANIKQALMDRKSTMNMSKTLRERDLNEQQ